MHKIVVILLSVLLVMPVWAEPEDTDADKAAIKKVVQTYVDGLNNRDAAMIKKAFHPVAILYGAGRRGLSEYPRWRWVEALERNPNKLDDAVDYTLEIPSISIAGPAAIVRVELDNPKRHYTDFLSLLKLNGEWKIVNKIYYQKDK